MKKEPPNHLRDLAWFGDREEIRHVIEVLRDAREALSTPDLAREQIKLLASVGVPWLREILENALSAWRAARPARAANNFEEPLLRALEMLNDVRHAGELKESSLQTLEERLTEAHIARLDAKAVSNELARRRAWRASARVRKVKATELHERIREDERKLLADRRSRKDVPGILARKYKRTPRHISNVRMPAKKRK